MNPLKQKLQSLQEKVAQRRQQLQFNIKSYKDSDDFQNALINQVKLNQFDLFQESLENISSEIDSQINEYEVEINRLKDIIHKHKYELVCINCDRVSSKLVNGKCHLCQNNNEPYAHP